MDTIPSSRLYGLGPHAMIEVLRERTYDFDDVSWPSDEDMRTKSYRDGRLSASCMDLLLDTLHGDTKNQAVAADWRMCFDWYNYSSRVIFEEGAWQTLCKRLEKWRVGFTQIADYESQRHEVIMMRPSGTKNWRFVAIRSFDDYDNECPTDYDPDAHWHAALGIDGLADEYDLSIHTFYVLPLYSCIISQALFGELKLHKQLSAAHAKLAQGRLDEMYGFSDPIDSDSWDMHLEEAQEYADSCRTSDAGYGSDDEPREEISKTLSSLIQKVI